MKTAIYIEDGVMQLVLTPENGFEGNVLGSITKAQLDLKIHQGQFYDCVGGWTRQRDLTGSNPPEYSVIIRLQPRAEVAETVAREFVAQ